MWFKIDTRYKRGHELPAEWRNRFGCRAATLVGMELRDRRNLRPGR